MQCYARPGEALYRGGARKSTGSATGHPGPEPDFLTAYIAAGCKFLPPAMVKPMGAAGRA